MPKKLVSTLKELQRGKSFRKQRTILMNKSKAEEIPEIPEVATTIQEAKKLFVHGEEFEYRSSKAGGANSAGVLGERYESVRGGKKAQIKIELSL